ncbi:MAG: phosphotransferase [Candidatus Paracaedibacteraceae bacterium]|nr:phosphotransferase [Candidatus Paracaedibacteraceae bacterium]
MLQSLFFLLFLFFTQYTNASPILQIGDLSTPVDKLRSCKSFAGSRATARCVCCLLTSNPDGYFTDKGVTHLCTTQNDCSETIIENLISQTKAKDLDALVIKLKERHIQNQNIPVSPKALSDGVFNSQGLKDFLVSTSMNNKFRAPDINTYFREAKCLEIKQLGDGGKQTLQIFLISAMKRCGLGFRHEPPRFWVLKETKKFGEVKNLQTLMASPVAAFDIKKTNRNPQFPAIAFPVETFTYVDINRTPHHMLLMDAAPGLPFAKIIQSKDLEKLNQASQLIGERLGALHKTFMQPSKNKILGPTVVHGDLHSNNIFVDQTSGIVTLIDVETFVKSFDTLSTPAVDLFMLYGFATSHIQTTQRIAHGLSQEEWHNNFFKPFLQGYVSNWPTSSRKEILKELKSMFNSILTLNKIFKNRFIAISYPNFIYGVKRYANPVFDQLIQHPSLP